MRGLEQVKGDFWVAVLGSLGDIGLLRLDNKEQAAFTQTLIDYCPLPGYPRGARPRSGRWGASPDRFRAPSRRHYYRRYCEGRTKSPLRRGQVRRNWREEPAGAHRAGDFAVRPRHRIGHHRSAQAVFPRYAANSAPRPKSCYDFEEHFAGLCDLLRAFGDVASKPARWSEDLILCSNSELLGANEGDDELEHPTLRVLNESVSPWPETKLTEDPFAYNGAAGRLYVTAAADFLILLQELNLRNLELPKSAQGLSRRLNSCSSGL